MSYAKKIVNVRRKIVKHYKKVFGLGVNPDECKKLKNQKKFIVGKLVHLGCNTCTWASKDPVRYQYLRSTSKRILRAINNIVYKISEKLTYNCLGIGGSNFKWK